MHVNFLLRMLRFSNVIVELFLVWTKATDGTKNHQRKWEEKEIKEESEQENRKPKGLSKSKFFLLKSYLKIYLSAHAPNKMSK